ncbi:MAG: T9SS C-terminal target domain-containing protein [Ignavibacteriae bacterium]|nr:MAG: T9SS C-terminal target domain-containing protein [Ignavibacteriota bacterium]
MKKTLQTFNKLLPPFLIILLLAFVLISQGQIPGHVFNDDDPLIEQPTREALSHFYGPTQESPDVITVNDYDNFDAGTDFWENHVSTNPLNPLWLFFGVNASGIPQNARGSTDGGITWYLNNPSYPGGQCCDPWTTHTGSGVLVYASGVNGQYVYRSTNNGQTWGSPILSVSGVDRNIVVAEETGTGPYANYVYAAITPGNFARSTNEGLTWTTTYSPSNSLPGAYIAVGPNGSTNGGCVIYLANTGSVTSRIFNFHRSTNGGANFTLMSSQSGFAGYVGIYNSAGRMVINNARTNPHPKIAMDNSNGPYRGRLYLVNASNEPAGNGNKPDIWCRYSTDQGTTFSTPVRVNDNPNPQASDQWFPEIWCEKTTGKLYVHWYDDRENPASYSTNIYASYSTDGGQTFVTNQKITNETWQTYPNPACSPNTNCYRGDYSGITANPKVAFSIWADHRIGHSAKNMGAYFPDYAMRISQTEASLTNQNDSVIIRVIVPSVKLYTDKVKFTATVTPAPGSGTITTTFLHKTNNILLDSLTNYPDSLRIRIKTTGGVTSGIYSVNIFGAGSNGTPVHKRVMTLYVNPVGLSQNNNEIPADYALMQNFPNPFNPATNIRFDMPKAGLVKLVVYDVTGRAVTTIINNSSYNAGKHTIQFNGENLSSGIYFYKIEAGEYVEIKKMILIK